MANVINEIVVLGAGGDGLVVAEAVRQAEAAGMPVRLAGFLDDVCSRGETVVGVPVMGWLDTWETAPADCKFVGAIQKVRDMSRRAARLEQLRIPMERWGQVIHPSAVIASTAALGCGIYIAAHATVQPGCKIGDFSSIRAGAVLGHDATMHRHSYVGPNATMCGRAVLGEGAHLGPNAVILDEREVGRFAVVGIGAAVTKNVGEYTVVMGNPARRVGKVSGGGAGAQAEIARKGKESK